MADFVKRVRDAAWMADLTRLVAQLRDPSLAEARQALLAVRFDALAAADQLEAVLGRLYEAKAQAEAASGRAPVEADQARELLAQIQRYLQELWIEADHDAPTGVLGRNGRLFEDRRAENLEQAKTTLHRTLVHLRALVVDFAAYGLDPAFVGIGEKLAARIQDERVDEIEVGTAESRWTAEFDRLTDEAAALLSQYEGKRDRVKLAHPAMFFPEPPMLRSRSEVGMARKRAEDRAAESETAAPEGALEPAPVASPTDPDDGE